MTKSYSVRIGSGGTTLVSTETFAYEEGKITFLLGESGIGKSLICKAIYGLLDDSALRITINNSSYQHYLQSPEVCAIKQQGFFVFQEPSTHLNPLLTISQQLNEGDLKQSTNERAILQRLWQNADQPTIDRILALYPKPYRPSGGEKQRALLAMAFKKIDATRSMPDTATPPLFIFDEPTGSLDNSYRNLFLSLLLEQYREAPFTAIIITHDYSIISYIRREHAAVEKNVQYRELKRSGPGSVDLRPFSPDTYLAWLQKAPGLNIKTESSEPVLKIEPNFSIFKKSLAIYENQHYQKKVPLCINKGQIVYLRAMSGAGKTTLVKIIMGLYKADQISLTLCGKNITERSPSSLWSSSIWGKQAGMVFQHADEALDLQASVRETFRGLPLAQSLNDETLTTHLQTLFAPPISNAFLSKKVLHLSGGQKQRLNLLRSFILRPKLLILDEPLNGLDFAGSLKVLEQIEICRQSGSAILLISHNEELFETLIGPEHTFYLK